MRRPFVTVASKRSCRPSTGRYGHCDRHWITDRLQWGVAVLALDLGVLSLMRQSGFRQVLASWIDIHFLFGLLLVVFSMMRLSKHRRSGSLEALEICQLSRELSRIMYLLIYAVIGLRQGLSLARRVVYGEPLDFRLGEQAHPGPNLGGLDLHDDLQALVASGLAALVFIRALMYCLSRQASIERV